MEECYLLAGLLRHWTDLTHQGISSSWPQQGGGSWGQGQGQQDGAGGLTPQGGAQPPGFCEGGGWGCHAPPGGLG